MAGDLNLSARIARRILLAAQRTRFRGVGGYSPAAFATCGDRSPFPQADREREHFGDFLAFFGDDDVAGLFSGRDVLDFGSGYGGKTVEFARQCKARFVWGVEPFEPVIQLSARYAQFAGVSNVEFRLCGHTAIPLEDSSVDVVVSHDVLEHVRDPRASMQEMWRVLRPGGYALHVFPMYYGAASHHLDYITTLPALHWVFSPATLVRATNSILVEDDTFGTKVQPDPQPSFDGKRPVLPGLNGLSGEHLSDLFNGFEIVRMQRHALGRRRAGIGAVMRLLARVPAPSLLTDGVTAAISCVLRKPA